MNVSLRNKEFSALIEKILEVCSDRSKEDLEQILNTGIGLSDLKQQLNGYQDIIDNIYKVVNPMLFVEGIEDIRKVSTEDQYQMHDEILDSLKKNFTIISYYQYLEDRYGTAGCELLDGSELADYQEDYYYEDYDVDDSEAKDRIGEIGYDVQTYFEEHYSPVIAVDKEGKSAALPYFYFDEEKIVSAQEAENNISNMINGTVGYVAYGDRVTYSDPEMLSPTEYEEFEGEFEIVPSDVAENLYEHIRRKIEKQLDDYEEEYTLSNFRNKSVFIIDVNKDTLTETRYNPSNGDNGTIESYVIHGLESLLKKSEKTDFWTYMNTSAKFYSKSIDDPKGRSALDFMKDVKYGEYGTNALERKKESNEPPYHFDYKKYTYDHLQDDLNKVGENIIDFCKTHLAYDIEWKNKIEKC